MNTYRVFSFTTDVKEVSLEPGFDSILSFTNILFIADSTSYEVYKVVAAACKV